MIKIYLKRRCLIRKNDENDRRTFFGEFKMKDDEKDRRTFLLRQDHNEKERVKQLTHSPEGDELNEEYRDISKHKKN